ncbi:hypothetical protein D3C74_215480 [compost metagenome]
MNYIFNILWFENEPTWFRMQSNHLKPLMERHCLQPNIIRKNGDDFNASDLSGNDFDLILMDYKLAAGATGDVIISDIRSNNILTDILFYSSQYEEMLKAIQELFPPIDGVYYANRKLELFQMKIEGLINKIVRRSEDLINLRGFVLDNSCDFEVRVKEILNICYQKFSPEEQSELEKDVQKKLRRKLSYHMKSSEKFTSVPPVFPLAVNSENLFNHSDRLSFLCTVIDILQGKYAFPYKEEFQNFRLSYEENISQYRNALGHRKSGDSSIEIRKEQIPIDQSLHQMMRGNINKYDTLISEIESFITQNI